MTNAPVPNSPSDLGVLAYKQPPQSSEAVAARWLLAWMTINLTFGIPLAGMAGLFLVNLVMYLGSVFTVFILLYTIVVAIPATLLLIWARQCYVCRCGILQGKPLFAARAITLSWLVVAVCMVGAVLALIGMIVTSNENEPLLVCSMLLSAQIAVTVAVGFTIRSLRAAERSLASVPRTSASPRFTEPIRLE